MGEYQQLKDKAVQRQLVSDSTGRELLDAVQLLTPKLNAYILVKNRRKTNHPTT